MKNSYLLLNLVFLLSVSVLVGVSVLTFNRIRELLDNAGAVDHTKTVLVKLEEIISQMKDAETGQRGYLITKDTIFLQPYYNSYEKVSNTIREFRTLTLDNPMQQKRTDTLQKMVTEKLTVLQDNIQYYKTRDAIDMLQLLKGKEKMDEIRAIVARMQAEENRLLDVRTANKNASERQTPYIILFISLMSFGFLILAFFMIQRELRQRLVAQKELEHKIESLNRSNAELEQFAYVSSHDLQEPLRKIRAFADRLILKHRPALNDDARLMLDKIDNAADRMQTLIDDLLRFSRTVNHEGDKVLTSLNRLVSEVLNDLSEPLRLTKAEIKTDPLPDIQAYPLQMRQLFQNLLSNALKFTKPDAVPVIRIGYQLVKSAEVAEIKNRKQDTLFHKISIEDNGIGFEEQYKEKIFVIFQRLHNRTEYAGTGIGLAICKRVVVNHKGYLTADSQLGEGTTFTIYLPVE